MGRGDDACLRICLGGNETEEHFWGYSSSSLEELLITPVSATINSETSGKFRGGGRMGTLLCE